MVRERAYFVYILASLSRVLYVGATSDLCRRMYQHKTGVIPGFTSKYKINRLVYYETTPNSRAAVAREREIKGWTRERKCRLVEQTNLGWEDLAVSWFTNVGRVDPSLRSG
jgi:putative endonuclease